MLVSQSSQDTSRGRSRSRSSSHRSRRLRARSSSSSLSSRSSMASSLTRYRKPARGSTRPLVISRNLRTNAWLPERMETVLTQSVDMYWGIGAMTAAAGNFFNLMVSCQTPFTGTTYGMGTIPGPTFAANMSPVQGSTLLASPMGWVSLSGLYTNYRVKRYRLEITVMPQSASDSTRLVVFPIGGEQIPSAAAASVNLRVLEAQPYARAKTCTSGTVASDGGSNTIVYYGDVAKDLGKSHQDYMGLPDVAIGTTTAAIPASLQDFIGVFAQQLNGANNVGVVTCQVKLSQDIEFYELIQPIN